MDLTQGEILYYIGIAGMSVSIILFIIFFIILDKKNRVLKEKLYSEYGREN